MVPFRLHPRFPASIVHNDYTFYITPPSRFEEFCSNDFDSIIAKFWCMTSPSLLAATVRAQTEEQGAIPHTDGRTHWPPKPR